MHDGEELNLSSVIEVSSPWKEKYTGSYLSKLIRLERNSTALILKEDCNKSLRFLYLALLMSKKNSNNMNILLTKVGQIKTIKAKLNFTNLSPQMARLVGPSLQTMHGQLVELNKRLEDHSYLCTAIIRLSHEFALVDPLLIMALRVVAQDYKMTQALDCSAALGLGQVEVLMSKFYVDKQSLINPRNKYVLFWPLNEIEYKSFRERGVIVAKENECFDQLSDSQTLKYEEYLMVEKVYSLL